MLCLCQRRALVSKLKTQKLFIILFKADVLKYIACYQKCTREKSLKIWIWLKTFVFCLIEPNLLSGTAHSVNRRGVKRRDLDIEELREILSSLLPFVRIEHILPINSEVLSDAVSAFLHLSLTKR